jgi:uncharacterized membrane protein YedE/YeeE
MFTAIVTAMLGVFWLGWIGVIDTSKIYVPETFLIPQIVGGVVFGIGFAIAGLCPGTSCVAAATGRIDGFAVVAGMFAGVLGSGILFASLRQFYDLTPRGVLTLPQIFGVSEGLVVFAVVLIAMAGFKVANRIEQRNSAA